MLMSWLLKRANQVHLIMVLRCIAIVIQLLLIIFVNQVLQYHLPWAPLAIIIIAEVFFTLVSFYYYFFKRNVTHQAIVIQVCADILFLSLLLYFSGGATNAFVSLLLIPIAIAAVTLTPLLLSIVALLAILSYSILLWLLPMGIMHGNMEGHFIGMWVNFLFSTLVVALVVGKMARSINQRELALASYREDLLKQEQVISLGVASAQVTHQLATPIGTVQLLADDLQEELPEHPVLVEMQRELACCRESLHAFRQMSFDIKEQKVTVTPCTNILYQIKDHLALSYPEITMCLEFVENDDAVLADASLLPALLNLINNAVRATKNNASQTIELTSCIIDHSWQLMIRDFGTGFTLSKLSELGVRPVNSEHGLGMAVFLSHTSLERLGGRLALTNHCQGGALVTVILPLAGVDISTKEKG